MNNFSVFETTQKWCENQNINTQSFKCIGSTNDEAKKEAFKITQNLKIYLADQQTQGRGRNKNSWSNALPGQALLWTWSLPLNSSPQPITGPLIGLALYQSLKKTWPTLFWSLKAPNDVYLKDKKTAGLLVESMSQGNSFWLLIGLGLNVLSHPPNLPHATHITEHISSDFVFKNWFLFLDTLKKNFEKSFDLLIQTDLTSEDQENLLEALNANPLKPQTWTQVSKKGDLIGPCGTTPWTEI